MSQFISAQEGHPSSSNHLAFMKNYSPGFIVLGPVKCNQANQAVKKCNETRFVDLFRVQIYEGDKSFRHKKWSKDTNTTTRWGIAMDTFLAHSEMKIYESDKSYGEKSQRIPIKRGQE